MMLIHLLLVGAANVATPTTKPIAAPEQAAESTDDSTKPKVDPMQAMAGVTKLLERLFPAGPDPDPVRLAAAREATVIMFPKGTYAKAMTGFIDRTAEHVLDMSEADFAGMFPEDKAEGKKDKTKEKKPSGPPSTEPLRVMLAKKDPTFDAKVAAVKAFASTMFVKLGDVLEPKFREGMSRALARKFDERQLAEIRGFLATPTGAEYGQEMVGLWFEPDVMHAAFQLWPEMMKMLPDLAKDGEALDAQIKGLGKSDSDDTSE